jgi:hypothetical protein
VVSKTEVVSFFFPVGDVLIQASMTIRCGLVPLFAGEVGRVDNRYARRMRLPTTGISLALHGSYDCTLHDLTLV